MVHNFFSVLKQEKTDMRIFWRSTVELRSPIRILPGCTPPTGFAPATARFKIRSIALPHYLFSTSGATRTPTTGKETGLLPLNYTRIYKGLLSLPFVFLSILPKQNTRFVWFFISNKAGAWLPYRYVRFMGACNLRAYAFAGCFVFGNSISHFHQYERIHFGYCLLYAW